MRLGTGGSERWRDPVVGETGVDERTRARDGRWGDSSWEATKTAADAREARPRLPSGRRARRRTPAPQPPGCGHLLLGLGDVHHAAVRHRHAVRLACAADERLGGAEVRWGGFGARGGGFAAGDGPSLAGRLRTQTATRSLAVDDRGVRTPSAATAAAGARADARRQMVGFMWQLPGGSKCAVRSERAYKLRFGAYKFRTELTR